MYFKYKFSNIHILVKILFYQYSFYETVKVFWSFEDIIDIIWLTVYLYDNQNRKFHKSMYIPNVLFLVAALSTTSLALNLLSSSASYSSDYTEWRLWCHS